MQLPPVAISIDQNLHHADHLCGVLLPAVKVSLVIPLTHPAMMTR
jgi:hypothetical protein